MLTLPLLKVLNQAIAALESRLTQPISIAQVAQQVGYSRYHFSRTFLVTTGMTPATYLRKRRLSEAARELATSAKPILEIALDYQFQSQEAFSRSFKQEFGVSPGRYRLQGRLRWLINKIILGAERLLYPGRGIASKPALLVPAHKLVATILTPVLTKQGRICLMPVLTATTSNAVEIRQAHRQDIAALCRLYHQLHQFTRQGVPTRLQSLGDFECFDATWLSNAIEKLLDTLDVTIWVAEVQGQVVGLAEVYLRADEPNANIVAYRYGYLQSLVVESGWRGHGIGRQLLAAAEAWSKAQGASELRLECWEFEQGPLGFYTQQGYQTLRRTLVRKL